MQRWWQQAKPHLSRVGDAEKRFVGTIGGPDSPGVAAADELASACADGLRWVNDHPCPNQAAGEALLGMMKCYTAIAHIVSAVADGRGTDDDENRAVRQVILLRADLAEFETRLSAAIDE